MRRCAACLIGAVLFLTVLWMSGGMVMAEELPSNGRVIELPFDSDPKIGPHAECYLCDENGKPVGYEDPSLSVHLTTGRYLDTTWLAADITIAGPGQIRTAMTSRYGASVTAVGSTVAKKAKAVFAVNGDYFSARPNLGVVIRQGRQYRVRCDGKYDVLLIDSEGDLHILPRATNDDIRSFEGIVINSFTFGPGLVMNGQRREGFAYIDIGMYKKTQRMAICQTGPLHYLCLCCEGPEDPGSEGLTLAEFTDLVMSFEGIETAYNLDGGSSSTAVFRTEKEDYAKVNAPQNHKKRTLCDIIYFASAWKTD